jgi:hypothetical protein
MMSLAAASSAEYVLIDDYTIVKWDTLHHLLRDPMMIRDVSILNTAPLTDIEGNSTETVESLKLLAENQPNEFGRFSRIYQFDTHSYRRVANISLLESGWQMTNGGSISNQSGNALLSVGASNGNATTKRSVSYDLGVITNSGFLLFEIQEMNAMVSSIEVFKQDGSRLRFAERLSDTIYICPLGRITIGDIQIVIEGNAGDSALVRSISLWSG